jgi:hypothetical protein
MYVFCRFYLAVLTDIATINKYSNNVQQLTFFIRNNYAVYLNTP